MVSNFSRLMSFKILTYLCASAQLPSQVQLCSPMDCSLSGYLVHRILQARILEKVAISYSRGSSEPKDRTCVSCISCMGRQIPYHQSRLGSPNLAIPDTLFPHAHTILEQSMSGKVLGKLSPSAPSGLASCLILDKVQQQTYSACTRFILQLLFSFSHQFQN